MLRFLFSDADVLKVIKIIAIYFFSCGLLFRLFGLTLTFNVITITGKSLRLFDKLALFSSYPEQILFLCLFRSVPLMPLSVRAIHQSDGCFIRQPGWW